MEPGVQVTSTRDARPSSGKNQLPKRGEIPALSYGSQAAGPPQRGM